MLNLISTFRQDRRAVTAIEYGLIAALIAVALIGSFGLLKSNLSTTFSKISTSL